MRIDAKGWKRCSIAELCDFSGGNGFRPNDWSKTGLPIIRIQNLNGSKNFNYYNGKAEPNWLVQPGELLFAWAGVRGVSFGPTIWKGPLGVLNQHIYRIHPKKGVNKEWLFLALKTVTARIEAKAHGFKSSLVHVHKSDIDSQKVFVPDERTQVHIAEMVGAWDRSLEKFEALLGAEVERKRGLMQQLLTGKTRFKEFKGEPWRSMVIGDLVMHQPRVTTKPKGSFLAAGIRSHGKGVFLKADFDPEDIALDELFQLRTDDLVVNITFGWEGAVAIVPPEAEGALVSHRFPTFTFKPTMSFAGYFRHVIRQKRFVHEMGLASPGGAGRNRVLSKSGFLRIPVELPSLEEQQRIASVLDGCDREIDLLEKQLAALKEQKRGLMQKLLTGEVRVKLKEEK